MGSILMVEIDYIVAYMALSRKKHEVKIVFQRVPTQEQLDVHARQLKAEGEESPRQIMSFNDLMFMRGENNKDIDLNFDKINFILTLKEVVALKLEMGMLVQLDIPERPADIIKVES